MTTPRRFPRALPVPAPRPAPDGAGLDWRARGACVDLDPDLFFPDPSDSAATRTALAACSGCPVRLLCLGFALAAGEVHGVWGGTTEDDRRELLARRRRSAGPSPRRTDDAAGAAGVGGEAA